MTHRLSRDGSIKYWLLIYLGEIVESDCVVIQFGTRILVYLNKMYTIFSDFRRVSHAFPLLKELSYRFAFMILRR